MAIFCIPKHLIEKLKESAIKGQVDIKKLYDMSSAERREFFSKLTNEELGKLLNTEFEKAMVSKQKTALLDWAKSAFTPEAKSKPVYKNIVDKINALDEMGVLNPKSEKAFLEDLVSDRLGLNVTPEQIKIISEKAEKIDKAQKELGSDLGDPAKANETLEFFKAKGEMDEYLQSLNPASQLKVLTGTIGRGMMLFSVKSPILNIGSNIEIGAAEAISRRLSSGAFKGADNKLATDYIKLVNRVYKETGYDMSRMTTIFDTGSKGGRVLGETMHAEGPGAVRKVGRVVEDIVFKRLMGSPDVAFSSAHFADSVNTQSLKLAKGDKTIAREYMTDAMRLDPQTPQGEILRQQGILDAQTATWTGTTWASKFSEGARRIFNDLTGDARVGDYLFPFVKTPANVIATGIDYAGVGVIKGLVTAVKAVKTGDLKSKETMQSISRDVVRSGLGLTAALAIASQLDDDDFVGAWDPKRAQIEALRNSNTNSVRIGGKWISVDWLAMFAPAVSAIMYARKYGKKGKAESVWQYGKGVAGQAFRLPVVSDIIDTIGAKYYKADQSLEEMTGEAKNYIISQASSRLMPSFISDIAKATDKYQRTSTKGYEAFKAKVPGLRQTLPIKTDILGKQLENEPAWSTILFGARVKSDRETAIIKEINTVSQNADKSINFTDWDKSSSKTLAQFKEKKGQAKFDEAKLRYGKELEAKIEKAIRSSSYKRLTDEEKAKVINGFDTEVMNNIFRRYGFKYKPEKTKKLPSF